MTIKVQEKSSRQLLCVAGNYWDGNNAHFYRFPKGNAGIVSYSADEVEISDPAIDGHFEYLVTSQEAPAIFHRNLLTGRLMDSLLGHEPAAYERFVSSIGIEP